MKEKILIVEDDEQCRKAYKFFFEDLDYDVQFANSLNEVEKYSNQRFKTAIIDGLEGKCFEAYEKINAERKIIRTGDERILEKCKLKNIEGYNKLEKLSEIIK